MNGLYKVKGPCPFCGCRKVYIGWCLDSGGAAVICESCGSQGPKVYDRDYLNDLDSANIIDEWNMRYSDDKKTY